MKQIFITIVIFLSLFVAQARAFESILPNPRDVNMENIKRNFDEIRLMLCTSEIFTMSIGQTTAIINIPWITIDDNAIAAIKQPPAVSNATREVSINIPMQNLTIPEQTITIGTESIIIPSQIVLIPSQTFNQDMGFPVTIKNVSVSSGLIIVDLTEPTPVNITGEILIHKKIIEKRY